MPSPTNNLLQGSDQGLKASEAEVERAAWAWRNDKDRETDSSDQAYFRANWQSLPGLRRYVVREVEQRELQSVLGDALKRAAELARSEGQ